jgi:hypothetical protein
MNRIILTFLFSLVVGSSFSMNQQEKKFYSDCVLSTYESGESIKDNELYDLILLQAGYNKYEKKFGIQLEKLKDDSIRVLIDPDFITPENHAKAVNRLKTITEPVNVVCFSDSFTPNHMEEILQSIPTILSLTLFGIGNLGFSFPDVFWKESYGTIMFMAQSGQGPVTARIRKLLEQRNLVLGQNLFPFIMDKPSWFSLDPNTYNLWKQYAIERQESLSPQYQTYNNNWMNFLRWKA